MNDHSDLNIDNAFDMFREILLRGFTPDVMIVAHPEGTWLLQRGEEPNVVVISHKANRMKGESSPEEFIALGEKFRRLYETLR